MSANSISSRFWRSLGRKRISFLPGSIKRDYITLWRGLFKTLKYIQKVTSFNSVGILACKTVWSTVYSFSCTVVALEKGWNIPHSAALGIPTVRVTWTSSTSFDHVYLVLHKQHKSYIQLLYYASSLLFSTELSEMMSEYSWGWNVIGSSAF